VAPGLIAAGLTVRETERNRHQVAITTTMSRFVAAEGRFVVKTRQQLAISRRKLDEPAISWSLRSAGDEIVQNRRAAAFIAQSGKGA
jgi:hypothetical protein